MPGEEELGTGDVLGPDPEHAAEPFDERPPSFEAEEVADVGTGRRAEKAEQDDQDDRVVAGRRPGGRGQQQDLARKRNA